MTTTGATSTPSGVRTRYAARWFGRSDLAPARAPRTPISIDPNTPWVALGTHTDPRTSEVMLRTLERGRIAHSPAKSSVSGGINGALQAVRLVDSHTGQRVKAVLKPLSGGGAQELFAYEVAQAMHVDRLLPHVARRADGAAAIQFVRGDVFYENSVEDSRGLEEMFRHQQALQDPVMSSAEVRRMARVKRQLVQTFDYVLANGDRHPENGIFDARTGALKLIDHGLIQREPIRTDRLATVRYDFMRGQGVRRLAKYSELPLTDEVVAILERTDRPKIEQAFKQLMRDTRLGEVGAYAQRPTKAWLGALMSRLDDAIAFKALRYVL